VKTELENASGIFGNRLKFLRSEKQLSQKQVADRLDVAVNTYANWEQGRREPGIIDIYKIISALEVLPNDLFGDDI
jgi:transcriptional regulator with XRE-family HTH domain